MTADRKPFRQSLSEEFALLGVVLRVAFSSPILDEKAATDAEQLIDPDFKGWLQNDPMVTMNPASRYGDDATGFLAACDHEGTTGGQFDD